ncbi:M20/M25/M40 family metallo-hydrolase [Candidatus Binatus sp.]|uniref:M20/M25/M40 family metallo-hydrolase n=1 Tax=Candidatus Binatus sp. TaxID=2811406 RepID=UPI003C775167
MTDEPRRPGHLAGPVTLALLILVGFLAIRSIQPPSAVDADAPATEFSATRAMRDVREIAKRPHPLGSAENDRVREYLVGRLRELGANPEVQTTTVARHSRFGPDTWAVVNNVVAKIPGSNPTGAVLIVAHYDSAPSGPGAGDDAASVAAILEALRALKAGPALRNDLIVLFTDGEELGLLGAKGFVETYPALRDIKVTLNFDMRGDYGPSVMIQTSAHNSWLVDQFAVAAPFPRGSSEVSSYRRSVNETDLDVFLDAGMAGMNFAATGGITRYHTALDNADSLDARTLQHQGSYALSMAGQFGSIDLNAPQTNDAVFFVVGGKLIHYSARLAIPLAILVTLLVIGVIWIGIRSGRFSLGGVAAGGAIYAAALAFSGLEAFGLWWIMTTFAGWRMLPVHTTYGGFYYWVAVAALIFGTLWAAYELIGQWFDPQSLGVGALALWTVLMLATSIRRAGDSFVLIWPLLFATLAIGYRARAANQRKTLGLALLALVALIPGITMIVPGSIPYGTINVLIANGVAFALLFGLFIPYIDFLTSGRRWIVPGVLGLLALVMIIKGNAASDFDASQPHPDSIFYFQDTDRERARWVSLDSRPDRFTAQFFQHHVLGGWLPKLVGLATRETPDSDLVRISHDFSYLNRGRTIEGDAPLINAPPPTLKVLDDSTIAGTRTVKMHIASARTASVVWMSVPVGVTVLGSSIDGRSPSDRVTDGWTGWYWHAQAAGFDLTLKLATPAPFIVTVIDQTDGLPNTPELAIKPRPPDTMPTPFLFFDSTTLVRKTFAIGGEQVSTR